MKAVNLEKLLPARHSRWREDSMARQAAMDQPRAPRLSRRFCRRLFRRADGMERLFGRRANPGWGAAARVAAKTLGHWGGRPGARRAAQLPLRAHDALRRDLPPPGHEDRRRAADLHQHAVQADRLRVRARLRRRNRRHSGLRSLQRAGRLFRAVAARAPVPFRPPRALAALRRQRAAVAETLSRALREAGGPTGEARRREIIVPGGLARGLAGASRNKRQREERVR